jgi:hypothetical protein
MVLALALVMGGERADTPLIFTTSSLRHLITDVTDPRMKDEG